MEAKECWHKAREQRISIYASKGDGWRLAASNPKRLSGSIILDSGIEEDIVQDVRDFLVSKKWYLERGIPFRRGYLLVSYTRFYAHSKPLISHHNCLGL